MENNDIIEANKNIILKRIKLGMNKEDAVIFIEKKISIFKNKNNFVVEVLTDFKNLIDGMVLKFEVSQKENYIKIIGYDLTSIYMSDVKNLDVVLRYLEYKKIGEV